MDHWQLTRSCRHSKSSLSPTTVCFRKSALLDKREGGYKDSKHRSVHHTDVSDNQQPSTMWTGLLQTTRALKVRHRKFHVNAGEAIVHSDLGRAVGLCSTASAEQKHAQTRLIKSRHLSEQYLTKSAEYNVKNSCWPLRLKRHCIII